MAIAEIRPRSKQILNDIFNSYASSIQYKFVREPQNINVSSDDFATNRRERIYPLVAVPDWSSKNKNRDSFMAEWFVMLGLRRPLGQVDLNIDLAPPRLEIGTKERSGVDLIISKTSENDILYNPVCFKC